MLFADLLFLHLVTFLMLFILVHVTFFWQQMHAWAEVCHLLQSSKSLPTGFLCSIGWRIIDHTSLSSNTPRTLTVFLIQQSCVIITFCCQVICAHAYTWRKNGNVMEAIVLQWAVRISSCDFKPGKKRWAGALLSEKCCCFIWKPLWKSHSNLN